MSHEMICPNCKKASSYVSSEIGLVSKCPNCSQSFEFPMPEAVQNDLDTKDEETRRIIEKWNKHNHLIDPRPMENPNGFISQLIEFSEGKGKLGKKLKGAGFRTFPPTEDIYETLSKFNRVWWWDLIILPKNVRAAFRDYRKYLQQGLEQYK